MNVRQAGQVSAPAAAAAARRPAAARRRASVGDIVFTGVSQLFLMAWAIMVIFPLVWMVITAFKTDPEILFSPWKLPAALQLDNFARAWTEASIGQYFINSLIVVTGSLILTLL